MKSLQLFLFFYLFGTLGYSQSINDLKVRLQDANDTELQSDLLYKIGEKYEVKNLDSALYYYQKALIKRENVTDTIQARIFNRIAGVYLFKGYYDFCLDNALKSLKIYDEYPFSESKLKVNNTIALVYFYQGQLDKALHKFKEIETLLTKVKQKKSTAENKFRGKMLNNMGIIYASKNQHDLALEYFAKASTQSKKANDLDNLSSIYANIGLIYLNAKRYDLAEAVFIESLEIRKKEKNTFGLCKSNQLLGILYKEKRELEKAEKFLNISLQLSDETNSLVAREEVIKELGDVMALKGNFKQAYQYQLEYKTISDSLFNKKNHERMIQAEMQYKFDKENQIAQTAQKQKEYLFTAISLFLFLIIVIVVIMYRLQKSKVKINHLAKERAELENKEFLLRETTLNQEIEIKSKELTTNILYLLRKNELIEEVTEQLKVLKRQVKKEEQELIKKIISDLKNAQDENVWKEFEVRFNQVYSDFYNRLNSKFPDLTVNEKRICAFLKLNMTSKEICSLTRQSYNSLNVARTRLRKKLNIQNEEINLVNFLESI